MNDNSRRRICYLMIIAMLALFIGSSAAVYAYGEPNEKVGLPLIMLCTGGMTLCFIMLVSLEFPKKSTGVKE